MVAGGIFLPLAQGIASASTGFPTVQAGGPPPAPAPRVVHVPRPIVKHHVKHKRIFIPPRREWHRQDAHINVHNLNHNFNRDDHDRRHVERRLDRDFWRTDFKHHDDFNHKPFFEEEEDDD